MTNYDPNYIPKKSFALVGQKAIILNSENKILLLQRSDKCGAAGKWSLPGGALEKGEEPFESIQREIKEETQLNISDLKPYYVTSSFSEDHDFMVIIAYSCKAMTDNVNLNWEHDHYLWLSKEKAFQLDLTSNGKLFLEKFDYYL